MAAMGIGGVLVSLLAACLNPANRPSVRLRAGLLTCAAAAALTLLPLSLPLSVLVAFLIGAGLGLLTVTLVTNLASYSGGSLLPVGLGTGLGYFLCNFPPLFTASPQAQAVAAATLCCVGIFAATNTDAAPMACEAPMQQLSLPRVLLGFTALVWLDSAAFFIIQNTPALKAGTWQGTTHLWTNASLHLAAALLSVWLLRRRGLTFVLGCAFAALTTACLLLLDPSRAVLASVFYPVGVSLYSVALVAYPALLFGPASTQDRARRAGWIYAIAGWFGSAMGIGMGQNLGHIPPAFVLVAAVAIFAPQIPTLLHNRRCEVVTTVVVLLVAGLIQLSLGRPTAAPNSAVERGRKVYIAEGCINCHSQYVRPNTRDVVLWGPAQLLDTLRTAQPPLIGNRRQGPDLSEIGGRRSPLWLRAHFINPQQISHASFMPSYEYLFRNSTRGDDLIAYLSSLKSSNYEEHIRLEESWQPAPSSPNAGAAEDLFSADCATCHTPSGPTRVRWQRSFEHLPPNLQTGPWSHLPSSDSPAQRQFHLARIIKFGIPGTDMPGHEYLSDHDITSIAIWLNKSIVQPSTSAPNSTTPGEIQ